MQARYAAARATVLEYTLPVPISKKTSSQYSNSDEDSDGSPPSPKRTDSTEMKRDESLQVFIEALPHLELLHYGFKRQASNQKEYCFCPLAKCLSPWRKKHHVDYDYSVCGARHFQGPGLLQHCRSKGDEYHTATAFYLTKLFNSLPAKSVLAGTKLVLFGRYVLKFYVGIVHYILREMKTWCATIYLTTQPTNR
jgi:hypothetical protein